LVGQKWERRFSTSYKKHFLTDTSPNRIDRHYRTPNLLSPRANRLQNQELLPYQTLVFVS
jgi:hypothetical protein